jgi:hypothetical protein
MRNSRRGIGLAREERLQIMLSPEELKVVDNFRFHHRMPSRAASKAPPIEPLLLCRHCNVEMCLFGIETESAKRELYTFECIDCGTLEVRGVKVR